MEYYDLTAAADSESGADGAASLPGAADLPAGTVTLTAHDIAAIIRETILSLRVYVVESDITAAQQSVKAVVEQSSF